MALTKIGKEGITGIDNSSNATAITIDSSENVGIGTSSPQQKLHINGSASDTTIQITNSASGSNATDGFSLTVENPSSDVNIRNREATNMRFYTSNSERMRIDSSGNVGIGTTSPAPASGSDTTLEIAGSSGPSLTINDTGQAEKYSLLANADDLKIYYGSTPMVSFQNDGNVGIGTASPADKLHIYNGSSGITSYAGNTDVIIEDDENVALQFASPNTVNQQILFSDPESNVAGKLQYNHSTDVMSFDTNGSERLRIDSDGIKFHGDSASSNGLNDYETGSFTPTYTASSSNPTVTYSIQSGFYVKVGKLVHIQGRIRINSVSGGSGALFVSGLPFSNISDTQAFANFNIGYSSGWNTNHPISSYIAPGNNYIHLIRFNTTSAISARNTTIKVTDMNNSANQCDVMFSGTYMTNA